MEMRKRLLLLRRKKDLPIGRNGFIGVRCHNLNSPVKHKKFLSRRLEVPLLELSPEEGRALRNARLGHECICRSRRRV
jgi:hypothetical protein